MKRFLTIALTCLPLLCIGAPTYTTYFNNTHTYTNSTTAGTNSANRGVFTNGITAGASAFTGEITSTLGTITADASALDSTATWNNAGVTFTGLKMDITDTASAAASILMDLQVGAASRIKFFKTGGVAQFGSNAGSGSWGTAVSSTTITLGRPSGSGTIDANTEVLEWRSNAGGLAVRNNLSIGTTYTARDVILERDAANTLALRNSTAAQRFNIYNTYTDASNYERGTAVWSGSTFFLVTESAGTGVARDIAIGTSGSAEIEFWRSGAARWKFDTGSHLLAVTDNSFDIGASGATRPRNVYVGTDINLGGSVLAGANARVAATGLFYWDTRARLTSPANSIVLLQNAAQNDFDRLQFGGTSASFPALKRSSTELQVRLADDSADAPLKSGQLSNTGIRVMTPSSLQTLAAANALLANATKVRVVGSGGAVTLTSTPTIADGSDGQYVMIQGTDDTNTLTVQDQGSLASSNLELGAATRVLGAGDVLVLTFDSTASVWYEVSFANN